MTDAPFMLGVSGARGIVGKTMTPEVARRFAACWGSHLVSGAETIPAVCLGRDSRPSGPELAAAAAAGLAAVGCRVIDLGVVATPTVGVMIGTTGAAGGVVITASHNPTPWNGLKLLDHHGTAPSSELAAEIVATFRGSDEVETTASSESITTELRGTDTHVSKVLGLIDPMPLRERNFTVVLDSVNGAGTAGGHSLLDAYGCDLTHLGSEPNGDFWHTHEPIGENLTGLCEAVREHAADIGCAQDPDADRLALVDEQGHYIGEEYTLALAAWRVLLEHPGANLVTNLSTSRMIDDVAERFGATVYRSAVGEANVAAVMREHNAIAGGEGNGGIILPAITFVRDSLSGMALVLDLMRREGKTLSALVDEIPRYVIIKEKLKLVDRADLDPALAAMRAAFCEAKIDDCDGLRVDLPEGWAHLRPSNTEPIARIIVEAATKDAAGDLLERVRLATGL